MVAKRDDWDVLVKEDLSVLSNLLELAMDQATGEEIVTKTLEHLSDQKG
jgi:hypothetical protein